MLILLSPAKIQNFKPQNFTEQFSIPEFMKEAGKLVDLIRELSPTELSNLLDINSNLTQLNFDRYFNWHKPFTPENAKQAVMVFDGEVYRGLDAKSFSDDDFEYAQNHLRLLSGLYGVLRPLDLIQPYRLEVSSKLINPLGNNLYDFWQKKVTKSVLTALVNSGKPEILLNLSSAEYFKSLNLKNKKVKVIDVEFYEYKHDNFKQIVIYTKKARGLMAGYVIKNRIEDEENLKGFDSDGYWYSPQMSTDNKLVFIR
ncbi:MAG TPA: peroxide stress protein YaaA [Paludibacter sp.]|nr:peroxide stress protein YaaA [Paludibacter sp.]